MAYLNERYKPYLWTIGRIRGTGLTLAGSLGFQEDPVGRRPGLMARQGCALKESEIQRIVNLLASTDMSLPDIAQRTGCSRGAIAAINRRYQVREYGGHRTTWAVTDAFRPVEENI